MVVVKYLVALTPLFGAIAVRDNGNNDQQAEPHALDQAKPNPNYQPFDPSNELHKLQEAIPVEMRESKNEPFTPIDWFKPTHGELKFGKSTMEKGAMAEGVEMVGATAAQMQTWAAEAGQAMKTEQDEYEKFKRDMDEQAARADTLHSQMKWEIMKKDKVRMDLLNRAAQFDGDGLHFINENISDKNWHKDEPEHQYTPAELGLEDAQIAGEMAEAAQPSEVASDLENTSSSVVVPKEEHQNVWNKILKRKEMAGIAAEGRRTGSSGPSPFTAAGQAARKLAEEMEKKKKCHDIQMTEWCMTKRGLCKDPMHEFVFINCQLTCGACPTAEEESFEDDDGRGIRRDRFMDDFDTFGHGNFDVEEQLPHNFNGAGLEEQLPHNFNGAGLDLESSSYEGPVVSNFSENSPEMINGNGLEFEDTSGLEFENGLEW